MKKVFSFLGETLKIVLAALIIVIPIRYFIFQPFFVKGQSMEPNFETGDYLIIDEISYRFREPQRGEVVVFKYPQNPSQRYIKRIIGLPGETVDIADGKLTVYKDGVALELDEAGYLTPEELAGMPGKTHIVLDEDEYFVMGDNRPVSYDSRRWGPLPKENIIGRVLVRAWPFAVFAETSDK